MEARNLASGDSIGRDDTNNAVRKLIRRLSGKRKKGSNAGHASRAMYAGSDGGSGRGKSGDSRRQKGRRRGQHGRGVIGTNEGGGGSSTAARGDGSSAKATSGSTPVGKCHRSGKKGYWRSGCTAKLCSRCQGQQRSADACPTSPEYRCSRCNGRGHTADICPSSKE